MKDVPSKEIRVGGLTIGGDSGLVLIAGPCVIEGKQMVHDLAGRLKEIAAEAGIPLIFKASYDKANRTSLHSYRGPGLHEGLEILMRVKRNFGIPVLADVHRFEEIESAAEVLDIIQIPAFLCRQTDFLLEVARAGRPVNLKKGQFLSPHDVAPAVKKIVSTGNPDVLVTERGTVFGYNNLVVDMRSLVILHEMGCPVVFDATHSVQLPGGQGSASGGERKYVPPLARAAAAAGIDAVFMEVHQDPDRALCDGPNSLKLSDLGPLLRQLLHIAKHRSGTMGGGADAGP